MPRFIGNLSRRCNHPAWLAIVPFFAYVATFLVYPSLSLIPGTFRDEEGNFTLQFARRLLSPEALDAYWTSIRLSAVSAVLGALFGFLIAYAAVARGMPHWLRTQVTVFSGVAANFAGVPLAFAFIATLGTTGVITGLLRAGTGVDLQRAGFSLYSFAGLVLVYLYFQIPLMVLIITPALDGLRREWREAAESLGATSVEYWRHVAGPAIMPSFLGALVLLFGNAFSAYATAYALTSGQMPLVPVVIGQAKLGNVLSDPHFGDALALGMLLVLAATMGTYALLQRMASKWQG